MKQLFVSLKGSSLHIMMDMILKHTFLALYFILTILFCLVFSCCFFQYNIQVMKTHIRFQKYLQYDRNMCKYV